MVPGKPFRYMHQHYNLDRLADYGVEAIADTTRVVNPAWRQLDSQIRRQNELLSRQLVQFAQIQLSQELEPEEVQAYEPSKGQLQQAIEKPPSTHRATQGRHERGRQESDCASHLE